nr:endonuclease domain-containing protein [Streptomyces sp. SID4948]
MAAWQQDRCAICATPGRRGGQQGTLVLDHDHETGLSRGYLCHRCNKRESHSTPVDGRYPNYRRLPPAVLLGLSFRYSQRAPQVPTARTAPAGPARDDLLRWLQVVDVPLDPVVRAWSASVEARVCCLRLSRNCRAASFAERFT